MVVIVLVNYNNSKDTLDCINSILKSNYFNFKIIVVDNCSSDDSFIHFNNYCEINPKISRIIDYSNIFEEIKGNTSNQIYFLRTNTNIGFAGGNNVAVNFVRYNEISFDYIWFLNNDTIIEDNTLTFLVERMNYEKIENSNIGVLGCKLFRFFKPVEFQGVGGLYNKFTATCKQLGEGELDEGQYDILEVDIDYPIGASLFVSKDFINNVGLMQEDYFLYFEELDWVLRGKQKGFSFGYECKARVFHKEGGTTKVSQKRLGRIADHCQVKNRILFTYRFYPKYLLTVIPMTFGSVINRILRGQFIRAIELTSVIFNTSIELLLKKNE